MTADETSPSRGVRIALRWVRYTNFPEIARRYFALNLFDGVLTMMGFIIGYYASGGRDPHVAFGAGLSASFAIGVSGLVSALTTEYAEREREINELGKAMLKDLNNTVYGKAHKYAALLAALVNGASPAIGALAVALPLWAPIVSILGFHLSVIAATSIGLALLFALGYYLGRIAGGGSLKYGAVMLFAGLSIAVVVSLVGR